MAEFQIRKDDLTSTRMVPAGNSEQDFTLNEGEILVKIEHFAFTANNITYGAVGEQIGYWKFFPPTDDNGETWGILPVWGFADVVASEAEDMPIGERLYGYFPTATYLKLKPAKIKPESFFDASEHRAALPPGYNMYRRVRAEKTYDPSMEHERSLLFPLHLTSFCIWDALQDQNWHGAEQILILSASSKTSIGLAYALAEDENAPGIIGITSARNTAYVERLKLYSDTVSYDNISDIKDVPTVIVDMSGNKQLLAKLHKQLGENMKHTVNVGMTHWEEFQNETGVEGIIASRSEFFFAPGHIQKRMTDWGPAEFNKRSGGFMYKAAVKSKDWLSCTLADGLEGLAERFDDVSKGNFAPDQGLIIKL